MNFFEDNNNILIGVAIGAIVPVLGYIAVEIIFDVLTNAGMMDEVTSGSSTRRQRTLSLIAICSNIIAVQFFKKRKFEKILNGIVTATMIYAVFWILAFKII